MTLGRPSCSSSGIIPYQELLGNYDFTHSFLMGRLIIPYQELLGNYDFDGRHLHIAIIIPYQELLGNYDIFP